MAITAGARRTALVAAPLLAIAGFALAGGVRSAAGAALGVAMVVLFFAGGRAPMSLARTTPAGQLFLLISLGYTLRIVLLLVAFRSFGNSTWLDRSAVAATVVAGSLLWTAALVHAHLTSRAPTLDIAVPQALSTSGAPL
jgi:ATP synthase protein I